MGGEPEGAAARAEGASATDNSSNAVVHVRCSNGNKFTVEVDLSATVLALKGLLVEKSEIPVDQQRLIYKGRVLKDEHLLNSYGQSFHLPLLDWRNSFIHVLWIGELNGK